MKTIAFVLAGGCGSRLLPLTVHEAKPALNFAGGARIIDFVLSNLVNSGIHRIYVLAQYKPQSLIDHVRAHWEPVLRRRGGFVRVVLPDSDHAFGAFLGTADAVHKTLPRCTQDAPDLVAAFAADHVYRMDVGQMVLAHQRNGADISVATLPVPLERSSGFGIVELDADTRIRAFQEKPTHPRPLPERPGHACASMGNYLFDPGVLRTLLDAAASRGDTDFGRHVLPRATRTHRVCAYDFSDNRVTGTLPHEEPHYWRDVGTIEAYRAAQQDARGRAPKFNLDNALWPIGGRCQTDPAGAIAATGEPR